MPALPSTRHDTLDALRRNMPHTGLFDEKSWLLSPEPFPLPRELFRKFERLGHQLMKFQNACNLLYRQSTAGRQPEWIARYLDAGKPPELVALARSKTFADQVPAVIRPDILLEDDGAFAISELDSVPGGIGLTAWLNRTYADLGHNVVGDRDGMLDGFRSILPDGGAIMVSEEASTYRPEMAWLASQLASPAHPAPSNPAHPWTVVDGSSVPDADAVYRFFELFDLANIPAAQRLLEAAEAGSVRLTPPPKPFLEEKLWMALFRMRPLEAFWRRELGSRYFRDLQAAFPYSWVVDPEPLPHHAVLPRLEIQSWEELKSLSQKDRALVLKISGFSERAWGSRGIHLGQDLPRVEWARAVDHAVESFHASPHILQEFRNTTLVQHPYYDRDSGEVRTMQGRARLCPYYFTDGQSVRLHGILATICPANKKIIHGMEDAILCPCGISTRMD